MESRISPEDNPVILLLKSQPIADKVPLIPTAVDVPEVCLRKIPLNLKTGSKPAAKVRPRPNGDSTEVVATMPVQVVTSNWAAEMAIGYRAGGRKIKSVIPKRRQLVKTMMYHSIKDFVKSLFRPPPSAAAGAPSPP